MQNRSSYYLSHCSLESYDLVDIVYNYFHNPEAEIKGYVEVMVWFCVDVKRKINNKDISKNISFAEGYNEVCLSMDYLLAEALRLGNNLHKQIYLLPQPIHILNGEILENKLDDEEIEFFKELLLDIPDSALDSIPDYFIDKIRGMKKMVSFEISEAKRIHNLGLEKFKRRPKRKI
ncbi:MAG: hypothetical protein ACKOQS_24655 [Dolichospermum sp.]